MVIQSQRGIVPCGKDLVSYTLDHNAYDAKKPVLIDAADERNALSLHDARKLVRRLVCGLEKYHLERQDTVCVHMFNHILYPILYLGIIGAGGRFTGSNPAYTVAELVHHFNFSQTKFIITEKHHLEFVSQAATECSIPADRIFLLDGLASKGDAHLSFADLISHGQKPWVSFDDRSRAMKTIANLNTTSGTTGLPKMAMRSHYSIVTENQAIEDDGPKRYKVKRLLCVPFFHAFAAPLAMISALRCGHTTFIMRKFDQVQYLNSIDRFQITETAMPPPMIIRFLGMLRYEVCALRNVQLVWSGGAPMTAEIQNNALRMLAPDARIVQVWGMTEGGWFTTFHYPESDHTGSVGRLIGSYEAKIVDETGQEISQPGIRGEIFTRGPINMVGYLGNPEASRKTIDEDGWLHTGDVAYFGPNGRVYIVDRIKELIKVRGWQVAPGELETRLLAHDDIIDTAVVGIPRPEHGTETPAAYVVRKPGSQLSAQDVKDYLLQYLAKYKVLDCEVQFRSSIPKSSSGKILKRVLRDEARKDSATSGPTISSK